MKHLSVSLYVAFIVSKYQVKSIIYNFYDSLHSQSYRNQSLESPRTSLASTIFFKFLFLDLVLPVKFLALRLEARTLSLKM